MTLSFTVGNQQGSALPIGMVLLFILTLLGVAGMNASRLELAMAGNLQNYEYVHEAAEAALQRAMAENPPSLALDRTDVSADMPAGANDAATGSYDIRWLSQGPVPSGGFSITDEFTAQHFVVRSTATLSNSNQAATHVQGYFVIAPGG
ncbi:MAG: pilus assembly PilX N-terminal domain-containing protein [Proteobacteria bacterium]|nr:pilus assembly PilX N-terminal domain-containing protein [Pseudomonadota bacterium]